MNDTKDISPEPGGTAERRQRTRLVRRIQDADVPNDERRKLAALVQEVGFWAELIGPAVVERAAAFDNIVRRYRDLIPEGGDES